MVEFKTIFIIVVIAGGGAVAAYLIYTLLSEKGGLGSYLASMLNVGKDAVDAVKQGYEKYKEEEKKVGDWIRHTSETVYKDVSHEVKHEVGVGVATVKNITNDLKKGTQAAVHEISKAPAFVAKEAGQLKHEAEREVEAVKEIGHVTNQIFHGKYPPSLAHDVAKAKKEVHVIAKDAGKVTNAVKHAEHSAEHEAKKAFHKLTSWL